MVTRSSAAVGCSANVASKSAFVAFIFTAIFLLRWAMETFAVSRVCSEGEYGGRLMRTLVLAIALSGMACLLLSSPALSQAPVTQGLDTAAGQQAFNNACRTCHTTKDGDNRQGPNLHGIIGRKAGSLPGYGYSSAMKEAGFVWDVDKLDRFIANPDAVVSGNSMKPFSGLASAGDRAKIVAFLQSSAAGQ
jgi:cytochrome c